MLKEELDFDLLVKTNSDKYHQFKILYANEILTHTHIDIL